MGNQIMNQEKKKISCKEAKLRVKGNSREITKNQSCVVKFGLNQITQLVEEKKAQLVIIAHDIDPIEIICWLPTLCKKMGVPYLIVRSKAKLGRYIHKKKATALAITGVTHDRDLAELTEISNDTYNNNLNR